MKRRDFLGYTAMMPVMGLFPSSLEPLLHKDPESAFASRLEPLHRLLETEGYYVWGTSPIYDAAGKVHVFYSRWKAEYGMGGWIHQSEIAHAVADRPEGPYTFQEVVIAPRGGEHWDATTCHNPHIKEVNGKYYLFYMGNHNKRTNTKRIGLAMADSLDGPWRRPDKPLLEAGEEGDWDDHCTTNPSFVQHPDGRCFLYYKSWNTYEYEHYTDPKIRGNRKYGLAIADQPEGPYRKYEENPIINYADKGDNIQAEDGFVWYEDGKFRMLMRDMGIYNHQYGLYLESEDGIHFSDPPEIAYYETDHYFSQPPKPGHLSKYGRFERPQILFKDDKPDYLFLASQGGEFMTSSTYLFNIKN
ncbi:glycoside hydrolase family protein [Echinicola rosea]|uniref:Glycosyl hydrolase family 43 n=1 Tax=Echinicola rosea TaxID=1807691 RepID=A0ABQ1UR41_9BACT|nr:glycoside hydrolase family protein [Echinicola rosea]GGF23088.1 hypothetical protein GCM10011339_08890 [Echinicola rosea]